MERGSALHASASMFVRCSAMSSMWETYRIELLMPMIGGGSQVLVREFLGQPAGIGLSLVCELLTSPTVSGPDGEGKLIMGPMAVCTIGQLSTNSENISMLETAVSATSIVRLSSTSWMSVVRSAGECNDIL